MKELVKENIRLLEKQKQWLNIAYDKCNKIGIKDNYSIDEFGHFETLCSHFSR